MFGDRSPWLRNLVSFPWLQPFRNCFENHYHYHPSDSSLPSTLRNPKTKTPFSLSLSTLPNNVTLNPSMIPPPWSFPVSPLGSPQNRFLKAGFAARRKKKKTHLEPFGPTAWRRSGRRRWTSTSTRSSGSAWGDRRRRSGNRKSIQLYQFTFLFSETVMLSSLFLLVFFFFGIEKKNWEGGGRLWHLVGGELFWISFLFTLG